VPGEPGDDLQRERRRHLREQLFVERADVDAQRSQARDELRIRRDARLHMPKISPTDDPVPRREQSVLAHGV
jgi:hypothetical protein